MSNDSQPIGKTRHITFGFVFAWIFAIVVGVPGIMSLFEHQAAVGILFILAALVALPPVNSFIKNKTHISLSGGLRVAVVIGLCFIAGVVLSQGQESSLATTVSAPSNGSSSVQATAEQPATAPAPAPIKMTADALYNAYTNNQIAADAEYKGNLVEVTGVINSIGKDILGNPFVALNVGEYSELGVQCTFSRADESQLTSLLSGQSITLEGTVTGETLTLVGLDGCSVINGQ